MELKPPTSSEENVDDDIPDDPWCDDLNPRICNFENISAAAYKIRDGIVRTPCDVWLTFILIPHTIIEGP